MGSCGTEFETCFGLELMLMPNIQDRGMQSFLPCSLCCVKFNNKQIADLSVEPVEFIKLQFASLKSASMDNLRNHYHHQG